MGLLDNKEQIKKEELNQSSKEAVDVEVKRKQWLTVLTSENINKKFCLVIGKKDEYDNSDSTGKTGLVLDHVAKELRKYKDARGYFIDVDDGLRNLAKFHKDVINRIYTYKPIQLKVKDDLLSIDYLNTIGEIRSLVSFIYNNYKELNIKYVIFDGLSTYKKWCEYQLRMQRHMTEHDTMPKLSYWTTRNKFFLETIQILKQLPIDVYLLGHDDFLKEPSEIKMGGETVKLGSLQKDLNKMLQQRIICSKHDDEKGNRVLRAYIDKSKGEATKEGKEYQFMKVEQEKVWFDSSEVFNKL